MLIMQRLAKIHLRNLLIILALMTGIQKMLMGRQTDRQKNRQTESQSSICPPPLTFGWLMGINPSGLIQQFHDTFVPTI